MKQRITIEQLQELTEDQKQRLLELWSPSWGDVFYHPNKNLVLLVEAASDEGIEFHDELIPKHECTPLLSIGQMIEIIFRYATIKGSKWCIDHDWYNYFVRIESIREWKLILEVAGKDLCDTLWSATKEILTVE